jgi:hypothetical protein
MVGDHGMAVRGVAISRAQLVVGAPVALAVGRWRFGRLRRAGARPYALTGVLPKILWQDGWSSGELTGVVLQFRDGTVVVTAVARFGFPGELAFTTDELEPYFAGYRRLVRGFLVPWSR